MNADILCLEEGCRDQARLHGAVSTLSDALGQEHTVDGNNITR